MTVLQSTLDPNASAYDEAAATMSGKLDEINAELAKALAGGGPKYVDRHHARGKLTPRERIELLVDPDSPFLELSPLAAYGSNFQIGASLVTGIGAVCGVECMIVANDPTVKGGTSNPWTLRKILRANQIAFENRLPVISLVESGGADLPTQKEIFIPGGQMFRDLTRLSAAGIPTIALVFGNSTAGGAYVPGMSDHVVMIKERSKVFLAGPPLVKMATGEESDDESLGGAEMHARISGLADYFALDELDAIRIGRRIVARLNWIKQGPAPAPVTEPLFDAEELIGIVPPDLRIPFDPREVIARIVDGSEFDEFKPLYGSSLVTGWARLHGYPLGILANARGVLFSEESQKATQFIQLANRADTPLLFLHNTTGYMVGKDYEEGGMIKHGSMMINAVSNSTVPHISLLIGASYGAGHYGMCGRLRPALPIRLAQRQVRGDGRRPAVGRAVHRGPGGSRSPRAASRRSRRRGDAGRRRGPDRSRVATVGAVRDALRRRGDRPARHPHRAGNVFVRHRQWPDQGDVELRRLPDVMLMGITRVLVANRGEIARRVFATCRRLGLGTVAVYTDPDAAAPHVAEADARVRLPQTTDYLNAEAIIAAAQAAGADAVHPGYGFLSENAEFAAAVQEAGLTWVGPPVDAVRAMGSKIESKKLMAAAGVPVLEELDPDAVTTAQLPVLVKASAGGGGRGMRVVHELSALPAEVEAARREAQSAFGDPTVFCERYLPTGHHVEVQVMADTHGTVWAVGERECSIQRRHQKIIEEAPSPLVERVPGMRAKLFDAARLAASAIGYTGAGTVEFLADDSPGREGEFYFLEMNTRLQVEHPVTEETTGLDLVELQLMIADCGRLDTEPPPAQGYSIEARLYAEDPAHGWQPQAGVMHTIEVPGVRAQFDSLGQRTGIRLDSGIVDGSTVSIHYDPMLAKVVSYGATRRQAALVLADALVRARLHGLRTNRELLVNVLRHPAFLDGATDTGFFDTHGMAELSTPLADTATLRLSAIAAALADAEHNRASAGVFSSIPSGWRNLASGYQVKTYRDDADTEHRVEYRFTRTGLALPGDPVVQLVSADVDQVVLAQDGVAHGFTVARHGPDVYVDSARGPVHLVALSRFPEPSSAVEQGSLVAPMPGNVIRIGAEVGDTVTAGQPLIWLEAMKMEHTIAAPADGVLTHVSVNTGQQVEVGAILARVEAPQNGPAEGDSP